MKSTLREQLAGVGMGSMNLAQKVVAMQGETVSVAQWKHEVRKRMYKNPNLRELTKIIKETHEKFLHSIAFKKFKKFVRPLYLLKDEFYMRADITPGEARRLINKCLW